jgi:hypothetical protein
MLICFPEIVMSVVKNQHYVPQFYLKRFSRDGNRIHVYDKVEKKSFTSSVSNVASAKYFYDLAPNPNGPDDVQVVEQGLAAIEGECAAAFKALLVELEQTNRCDLSVPERKRTLAYFISLQFCRTLQFRTLHSQVASELAGVVNNILHSVRQPPATQHGDRVSQSVDVTTSTELAPLEHAAFMFNGSFIERAMAPLMDCIWIVCDNQNQGSFYVSDSPVVLIPHLDGNAGFGSKGIEVVLPLSSRYLLTLWERTHFSSEFLQDEGTVKSMIPNWIPIYNGYQVTSSARQVYCADDDFAMIPDLMAKFPELGDPDRPRFMIR